LDFLICYLPEKGKDIFVAMVSYFSQIKSNINCLLNSAAGGRNRGGRGGHDALVGTTIKVRQGPFKGYRGRVVDIKGQFVRVELESQMKVVTGKYSSMSGKKLDPCIPVCFMGNECCFMCS
jgi:transcription elongation factor